MATIRIRTNRLKKGMIIKADVFNRSGVILVPANTEVTKEVYDLLTRHFIDEVVIDYSTEPKETPLPIAPPSERGVSPQKLKEFTQTFQVAEESLSQNLRDIVEQDKDIDIQSMLNMVNSVISKADSEVSLFDMLYSMKNSSESLFSHSINVSLYAQMLGHWVDFTPEEIEVVSLAGLLHDIGHLKYPEEEQKNFSLHKELHKRYHDKHPALGYKVIQQKEVDFRIKQAVLTHHERMDESGFPMGISFTNINSISRVLAIADTYATLTTEEPDSPAMSPFDVLKQFQNVELSKFDSRYMMTFIERISQNFIQHDVLLTNGQVGTIVMLNKTDLTKPLIQIGTYFMDLSIRNDVGIKKIL